MLFPTLDAYEAVTRGLSYGTNPQSCIDQGQWAPQCSNNFIWNWQTSSKAVVVHSILLYIVLRILRYQNQINLCVLFVLLSPGLLLTLPALTANECTGVSESGSYCTAIQSPGAACLQCQSILFSKSTNLARVLLHGMLFVLLAKISGNDYKLKSSRSRSR